MNETNYALQYFNQDMLIFEKNISIKRDKIATLKSEIFSIETDIERSAQILATLRDTVARLESA